MQFPIRNSRAIARMPRPMPRSASTLASTAASTRGRPKHLALYPRLLQISLNMFHDPAAFELREDPEHLEEVLASWRGGVDALLVDVGGWCVCCGGRVNAEKV